MQLVAALCALLWGVGANPTSTPTPAPSYSPGTTMPVPLANTLDIIAPAAVNLGAGLTGSTLSGALGEVTVDDSRTANPNPWVVTVTSTVYITGGGGPARTIPKSAVAYWSGPVVRSTGGGTLIPGQLTATQAQTLDVPRTAFRKTTGAGNNRVTWNPTLRVAVPIGIVGGTYVGTVTHSVA